MKTNLENDFKALEALRKANENDFNFPLNKRVVIPSKLYAYIEAVLKERVEIAIKEVKQ